MRTYERLAAKARTAASGGVARGSHAAHSAGPQTGAPADLVPSAEARHAACQRRSSGKMRCDAFVHGATGSSAG